jgi:hypothetical protein
MSDDIPSNASKGDVIVNIATITVALETVTAE